MTPRGWSGVGGVRAFSSAAPTRDMLEEMAAGRGPRGPDAPHVWHGPDVGLVQSGPARAAPDPGGERPPALPARSVDGRWVVVLDGTVLNHARLRSHLDYPFRTRDSAEVVVAGLAVAGISFLESLHGAFALVAHDLRSDTTHLVRDRMGIVPLHYRHLPGGIAFASEVKALLGLGPAPQVDQRSLDAYLALRAVPAPDTLFSGVKKVRPAHRVSLMPGGRVEDVAYWSPPETDPDGTWTADDAIESVRDGVREAVATALGHDGPVGVHLDGRLGSSLVAAQAMQLRDDDPVHTFSLAWDDAAASDDRTRPTRRLAHLLGTSHHEVRLGREDLEDLLAPLTWCRDAPLPDPADTTHHVLARAAGEHAVVLAVGHGADELFGGRPRYRLARAAERSSVLPGRLLGLGEAVERRLGSTFTAAERRRLLGQAPPADRRSARSLGADALDRMMREDLRRALPDDLEHLHRMTTVASLDLRLPLLDPRLVELALRLPTSVKVRSGVTSWVLREAARPLLPDEVIERRDGAAAHVTGPWWYAAARVRERLTGSGSWVSQTFDRTLVQELLLRHEHGVREDERIWTLVSLEMWHECFFGRAPSVPAARRWSRPAAVVPGAPLS